MTDFDLVSKLRDLMKSEDQYPDVVQQYAREVHTRYHHQAYNLARYYGLARNDAEDAVQESFIKAFRNLQSYDPAKEFKPWFFKILLNAVRDRYRDLKKNSYRDLEVVMEYASVKDEEIFDSFHLRDVMNGIISRLPEKLKSVLVMRVYGEMEFEHLSRMMRVSVRQLHNRLNKALELVKKNMEETK